MVIKKYVKPTVKYLVVFFATYLTLFFLLVGSARVVPRESLRNNMKESADFLCERLPFSFLYGTFNGVRLDRYADGILLGIAWNYDEDHPVTSVMWSNYYFMYTSGDSLREAVEDGKEVNTQYVRYWHGSNLLLRPLLLLLNIGQIYVLHGILLVLLFALLIFVLIREKMYVPAVGISVGLVMTAVWAVPFCLEYTWNFLVLPVASLLALRLVKKGKEEKLGALLLITGMVTNYLDFLTTETLTLLVPLLLALWALEKKGEKKLVLPAVKCSVLWGVGYAGMWVMKWITASIVLKENMLPYVAEHIEERLGGDIGLGLGSYLFGALRNNVKCLLPFNLGTTGMVLGIVLVLLVCYFLFVYRKEKVEKPVVFTFLALGLVPYIRFLVLHNHAYIHYFFTYRAQLATVVALAMITYHTVEWRYVLRANAGKRRH